MRFKLAMKIILAFIFLLNSFGLIAAATDQCQELALQMRSKGRAPAAAPRCETAGQLMSSNVGGRDFTNICRRIIDQDEGCKKLKPEKRMSCNAKRENEILSGADLLNKAGQCIKGFAWDSMVDLAKFVLDLIKMLVGAQVNSVTAMIRFLSDSEYRQNTLSAAGKAANSGSRLAKAFLNSAGLYFAREFPRNLAAHPFNPLMAVGKTLFGPLVKFMTDAVQQIAAHYIPQYQCMNGTAKLYTICRVLGDFIMPPAFIFAFLKYGVRGLATLSRTAGPKISRVIERFKEANETRAVARQSRITVDQARPPRPRPRAETPAPRPSSRVTATAEAHPPRPKPAAPLAKPIEEHSADELIELARSEQAEVRSTADANRAELARIEAQQAATKPTDEVLSVEEQAGRLSIDSQVEDLIEGTKNSPELIMKYSEDPEYTALFKAEKQYPEQGRDIAIVISDMEKKNPQMKKSEIREEIEKFLNTCELKR